MHFNIFALKFAISIGNWENPSKIINFLDIMEIFRNFW